MTFLTAGRIALEVPRMQKLDGYLRIREAAQFLGVAPNTLRNWGRDGRIAEYRHPVNNYRLYDEKDLERLLEDAATSKT